MRQLSPKVLTNDDLSRTVDTTDEWITQRTGIKKRHIAAEGDFTSDLATYAARAALADAGVAIEEIDLIVMATSTPDNTFPAARSPSRRSSASPPAPRSTCRRCAPGFVFGLTTADALMQSGATRALVIGAETFSRLLDWTDRATCVLFGDGAGADRARSAGQPGTRDDRGVLAVRLRSDGRYKPKLYVDGGPSATQTVGHLRMEGREVFRHAVTMITDVVEDAFKASGCTVDDIDWFVPHQANKRIIDGERTSSASRREGRQHRRPPRQHVGGIHPAGGGRGRRDRRIKRGDLLLLEAMGGGFTWGAVLLRW